MTQSALEAPSPQVATGPSANPFPSATSAAKPRSSVSKHIRQRWETEGPKMFKPRPKPRVTKFTPSPLFPSPKLNNPSQFPLRPVFQRLGHHSSHHSGNTLAQFLGSPTYPTNSHLRSHKSSAIMTQATLQTERLKFVPLAQEHYDLTKKLDQDPEVMKHIGFGRPLTDDETKEVHQWLLSCATSIPGLGTWVAYAGDEPIGWWILAPTPIDADKPTENFSKERSETGYRLLREFWGKGYATEGSKELVRHAFQDLGLTEVFGETMTVNAPSRKVMAKCGMKHVDTWFNEYPTPPPGIEEGEVRYRITKEEWDAQQ